MLVTPDTAVGEIISADFRAGAVFHQFGIDFCCGGGQSLRDACEARNLRYDVLRDELERTCAQPEESVPQFANWDADVLAAYIVTRHHGYVREALPVITAHLQTLARAHGDRRPQLHEVARRFESVAVEMIDHMAKEEKVLFSYIASIASAARLEQRLPRSPFASIDNPIAMMEEEHEWVGEAMKTIRKLTGGYAVPADACVTWRVAMQELAAFERDLHEHVHLENNVLSPKARAIA